MEKEKTFVEFYLVDETPVCVWGDGNDVMGFVLTTGHPYSPIKALSEGQRVNSSIITNMLRA